MNKRHRWLAKVAQADARAKESPRRMGSRRPGGHSVSVLYCHCGRASWVGYEYHNNKCHICGCQGNVTKQKPEVPPDKRYWECPVNEVSTNPR